MINTCAKNQGIRGVSCISGVSVLLKVALKLNISVVFQFELKTFASDESVYMCCCLAFYKLIQLVWMIIFMLVPVFYACTSISCHLIKSAHVYFNDQSFRCGFLLILM